MKILKFLAVVALVVLLWACSKEQSYRADRTCIERWPGIRMGYALSSMMTDTAWTVHDTLSYDVKGRILFNEKQTPLEIQFHRSPEDSLWQIKSWILDGQVADSTLQDTLYNRLAYAFTRRLYEFMKERYYLVKEGVPQDSAAGLSPEAQNEYGSISLRCITDLTSPKKFKTLSVEEANKASEVFFDCAAPYAKSDELVAFMMFMNEMIESGYAGFAIGKNKDLSALSNTFYDADSAYYNDLKIQYETENPGKKFEDIDKEK